MKVPMKKMVATVAMAGAITAGTAGVAVAQDGSGANPDQPAATAKDHPRLRQAVRRHAGKIVADTLGVSRQDLRAALKGGQSVREFAGDHGKTPSSRRARRTRRTPGSTRPSPTVASTRRRARRSRARSRPGSTRPWTATLGRAGRRRSRADAFRSEPGSPDAHRAPVSTTCPPAPPAGTFASGSGPALDNEQISAYSFVVPRRRPGTLLPIEQSILVAGIAAGRGGNPEFHGFALASAIQEQEAARRLTAHGTLYRALARMEKAGLLEQPLGGCRPRRRRRASSPSPVPRHRSR